MINKKLKTIDTPATKADIDNAISKIVTNTDSTIGKLAIMIQKGFMETAKQTDLLALTERVEGLEKDMKGTHGNFAIVFGELKAIRDRLDKIERNDNSAEIIALDIRVRKLEKKAKL